MGKLHAKFMGLNKGQTTSMASCFLGISLGPGYYKNTKLDAILELINRSKFQQGRFVMFADTLAAYNEMAKDDNLSLSQARENARKQGQEWLDSDDGKKVQLMEWSRPIIRWDEIIEHPDYPGKKKLIDDLFVAKDQRRELEARKEDQKIKLKMQFSQAVDRVVGERIASVKSGLENDKAFDFQRIKPLIVEYIKEECAAELIIAELFPCNFELYPGERNSAATFIHKHFIKEGLQWLTIKFSNAKSKEVSQASLISQRQDSPLFFAKSSKSDDDTEDELMAVDEAIAELQKKVRVLRRQRIQAKKDGDTEKALLLRKEIRALHETLRKADVEVSSNSSGSSEEDNTSNKRSSF